ncbi:response regulator transcription factor [Rhizorhabdus histidinilytica]
MLHYDDNRAFPGAGFCWSGPASEDEMGLNLLLVEDDAALVAMLERDLREMGHHVSVATDGRAAIEAVTRDRFDAMILDLMLPTVDGLSVLQRIRQDGMGLPVIILSALGRPVEKVEGSTPAPTTMSSSR